MKQINLGLIGYGRIAKTHLNAIHAINQMQSDYHIHCYSCLSTHPENVTGFERVYTDETAFFSDEKLDVVDICSPNFLHAHQIEYAQKYQKKIYCEKPVVSNLCESKDFDKIKDTGVALAYRYSPAVSYVKDLIDSDFLGKIAHYKTQIYHDSYATLDKLMTWRQIKEFAYGGASLDLGIHSVDTARFIFGDIDEQFSFLNRVFDYRYTDANHTQKLKNDTDEYMALLLRHQHIIGIVESSRVSKPLNEQNLFEIYGEKGTLVIKEEEVVFYSHQTKQIETIDIEPSIRTQKLRVLFEKTPSLNVFEKRHAGALHFYFMSLIDQSYQAYVADFKEALKSQEIIQKVLDAEVYA